MLSLVSLQYFLVAAEEMNFHRAADRLYISQQALSAHIGRLESSLDVKLFDRGTPLALTDAGKTLYRYGQDIFQSLDDCSREIDDIKDFRYGSLTIGIPVTRGSLMLPPLITDFHTAFPHIHLDLVESDTPKLIDLLCSSAIDLYIGYIPDDQKQISSVPIYHERFAIIIPHKFMDRVDSSKDDGKDDSLTFTAFARLPFVAQAENTRNGEMFKALCSRYGIEPDVVLTTQNLITQISLSTCGLGACVVPAAFVTTNVLTAENTLLFNPEVMKTNRIFYIDTDWLPNKTSVGICWKKNRPVTRAMREFIKTSQRVFSE